MIRIKWVSEGVGVGLSPQQANRLRDLWDEHVQYTRMAVVAFANNLPELDATKARLLANQDALGAEMGKSLGGYLGHQLTALLRQHIVGAVNVLAAAKSKVGVSEAKKAWAGNAEQIAELLAGTGRWPLAALQKLLRDHLATTIVEATAELEGRWADSVAAYDVARAHVLRMADALAKGM